MNAPARERQQHFANNMLRLGLNHVWREASEGREFRESLNLRSPIFRLTCLWDGGESPGREPLSARECHEWLDIVHRLENIFKRRGQNGAAFEEDAFSFLLPLVEPGIDRDLEAWPWVPQGYSPRPLPDEQVFGCFACEWSGDRKTVFIHFANACLPESPFRDIDSRREEIWSMAEYALSREPGAGTIRCSSWLNSFPPFRDLFPAGYPRPDSIATVGIGYNWWGQFVARDGGFHEKNGQQFRETGKFPYPAINGCCPLEELLTKG